MWQDQEPLDRLVWGCSYALKKEGFMGRTLARATEILAPYMSNGSNAGNSHVPTMQAMPC